MQELVGTLSRKGRGKFLTPPRQHHAVEADEGSACHPIGKSVQAANLEAGICKTHVSVRPHDARAGYFLVHRPLGTVPPFRVNKEERWPAKAQGICAFETKRIGGLRSAHDVSGARPGLSMKSAAILAPQRLKCLTL